MAHRHAGDIVCAVAANCSPCSFESAALLKFLYLLVFKLRQSSSTLLVRPWPNKLFSTPASFRLLATQLFQLQPLSINLCFFNYILIINCHTTVLIMTWLTFCAWYQLLKFSHITLKIL